MQMEIKRANAVALRTKSVGTTAIEPWRMKLWTAALGYLFASIIGVWAQAPAIVWVDDDWTGPMNCGGHLWDYDAFSSVQQGVNAAAVSGTVYVAAGTYPEQITIDKPLTLLGPNRELPGNSPARLPEAVLTYPADLTVHGEILVEVCEYADAVTIAGFDIRYQEYLVGKWPYLVCSSKVNDLTIRNNRMLGGEIAVYVLTSNDLTVYRDRLLVEGNFIDGGPFVNTGYHRGIYIQATGGTVQDNVIVNAYTGIQIMPYAHSTGGVVRRNSVSAGHIGLYHNYQNKGAAPWLWASNEVTVADNDRQGLKAQVDGALTDQPMTFSGIYIITFGMQGGGAAPQVAFNNNSIDGALGDSPYTTAREAVHLDTAGVGASARLFGNSFRSCTVGVTNYTTVTMDVSGNWWGNADPVAVKAAANNGSLTDYSPWLAAGTDTDGGAIGFKGDFSTLWADDNGLQVGVTGCVQEAINLVSSGGTVNVAAGNYPENVILSGKNGLVIRGPNSGLNNALGPRGEEATLSAASTAAVFTIEGNVASYTIDGLRIVAADCTHETSGRLIWAKGQNTVNNILNNLMEVTSRETEKSKRYVWIGPHVSNNSGGNSVSGNIKYNHFKANGTGDRFMGIIIQQCQRNFEVSYNWFDGMKGEFNIQVWHPSMTTIIKYNDLATTGGSCEPVWLGGPGSHVGTPGAIICNNNVRSSGKGIVFWNMNFSPTVSSNNFESVAGMGMEVSSGSGIVDAPHNWWGSVKGPMHAANPPGTGVAVSDKVDFNPWLEHGTDGEPLAIGFQPDLNPGVIWPSYENWLQTYFTTEQLTVLEISGDDADPDHDGMGNRSEYLANTIPTNRSSCLLITEVGSNPEVPGERIVRWQSASNRVYTLQVTTNLRDGFHTNLQTNILSTLMENVYTDRMDSAVQKFYRVIVE